MLWVYNLRRGKVEWRLGLWMGVAAILGGQVATLGIGALPLAGLDHAITIGFSLLLLAVSARFFRSSRKVEDKAPHKLPHQSSHALAKYTL